MNCLEYTNYYFIGIGGIGMSSLAEYMLHLNKKVGLFYRTNCVLRHFVFNPSKAGVWMVLIAPVG